MATTYTPFQPREQDFKLGAWGSGRDVTYNFTEEQVLKTLGLQSGDVHVRTSFVTYASNSTWRMPAENVGEDIRGYVTVNGVNHNFRIPTYNTSSYSHNQIGDEKSNTIVGKSTGGGHHDFIVAGAGNDRVHGLEGDDYLNGQAGNDRMYGGDGNDILYGETGADMLYGGRGNDTLFGGDGSDRLSGQAGKDTVTGGKGADNFVISFKDAMDTVTDFTISEKDVLSIENTLFSKSFAKDEIQSAIEDFVCARTVGNDTIISIDVDGKGAGKAIDIALLQNVKNVDVEVWHDKGLLQII